MKTRNVLEIAEFVSLAGSVAGSVAAVFFQQLAYAVAPLSLSLLLNWTNRQRFELQTRQQTTAAITQLNEQLSSLDAAKQQWAEALTSVIQRLEHEAQSIEPGRDLSGLLSEIEQLKNRQTTLEKWLAPIQIQLDGLREQFTSRPELEQIENLARVIVALQQYLDRLPPPSEAQLPVVDLQKQVELAIASIPAQVEAAGHNLMEEIERQFQVIQQPYEYELVMKRERSHSLLLEALEKAQDRLIVVCPWLRRSRLDDSMMRHFRALLDRNCCVEIGWGQPTDVETPAEYAAGIHQLQQLVREYPDRFKLKGLATHENFLVCDCAFAWVGSHDVLNAGTQRDRPEVGVRTTDPRIIEELIQRFDEAQPLNLPNSRLIPTSLDQFADAEEPSEPLLED
ncbi:phospholipase D-like domain-containing protein [Microcoleus sp. FACHB-68]|uniref:phospholipase D-like domain-containing protein n=1 Tax=Microcoleus sp. FACHB-68 TaxID=2692826 RepID=UPI00168A1E20|nr:phospholipase D-like domain-containing protein [Microcoleus sp. FACHB-68]MBD1939210.1 hypothetical protein [Microcoleus sp. FACHB-68]